MGDPRCPRCGRKVGATATACLHCGAEFDVPTGSDTHRHRRGQGASGEADGLSWLDRQLAPFREFRDFTVYLFSPAARNDPAPPSLPNASDVLRRGRAFLEADRTRLDATAVTTGFLVLLYFAAWAVPDRLPGVLAGLVVTAALFTRDSVLEMATLATLAIGLVTLVARTWPSASRVLTEGGTGPQAVGIGLAVPTVIGLGFLGIGVWLHRRVLPG